jgi:RNA polymerase sigma-70 factor (ECF subfamily)
VATDPEEAIWVVQAQCGDRDALERLLRGVLPLLHGYVLRMVGPEAADDVVQEALITVARKLAWLREPRLFRAWMFRIASRAAFRHLRRERRRGPYDSDVATLEMIAAPEPLPSDDLLRELLESEHVSPLSRAVLVLHFQEELPLADVAAILEIPVGTAKSRLAYGLKALRRHLAARRSS